MSSALRSYIHTVRIAIRELRRHKLEPETFFMDQFLSEDSNCLHIGASDGRHSFYMARIAAKGHVYCIEPSPYTIRAIDRLKKWFGYKNISTHNVGLSDKPRKAYLVTPVKKSGHLGRAFAFVSDRPSEAIEANADRGFVDFVNEEIALDTIDDFCQREKVEPVHFIRCDTEGAEHAILKGARSIFERDRPVLMIEVHPHNLKRTFNSSAEEVWSLISSMNYKIYYLKDDKLVPATEFFDEPWRDYFCVPAEAEQPV